MAIAVEIPDLAVVELTHDVDGHPSGAVGVVVSAHPERDEYTVEMVDASGRASDLLFAHANDLRLTHAV